MIDGASQSRSTDLSGPIVDAGLRQTRETAGPLRRRGADVRQTLYLDMTDLMEYAKHNGTLSGIQRVVSSLLTYAQAWAEGQAAYTIVPIVPEYDRFRVLAVDFARVVAMIRLIEEHQGGRQRIDAAINAVYDSRAEVYPRKGDLFVIAGAFWIYAHYDLIMRLRAKGVVFGLFVHDLIQIKNPQFVHKEATLVFQRTLLDALNIADFVLTNSHFVAREVTEFLEQRLDFRLPVAAVPLATELRLKAAAPGAQLPEEIRNILQSDYVLCVGTIEVRKNHLLLVKIWERLVAELGDAAPDLVFVGKWGWDIQPLRDRLDASQFVQGRVRVVGNASDAALAELYRHCLMTAYVSFAEGFGLPVGESLAYGKPCVASRETSLPEVGGAFAKYIDAHDPEEGVRLFKSLLTHREDIALWAAEIRAQYAPKTWRAFTEEFLDACCEMARRTGETALANNCLLPAGRTYRLGDDAIPQADDGQATLSNFRMARDANWHPIERWGCWSAEREAALQFRTDLPEGAAITAALLLHAPPGTERASVTLRLNDGAPRRLALYRSASWCGVSGVVGPQGVVRIALACEGEFGRPDTRHLYVGLSALEIAGAGSPAGAMRRRALLSRSVAAARWAAARAPGRQLVSSRRRAESLRQLVRETVDERLGERPRDAGGIASPAIRVIGPGGEIGAALGLALPSPGALYTPPELYMTAANCLARDFYAAAFAAFCESSGRPVAFHRRIWEYAFVARWLETRGVLVAGSVGLAISDQDDPLPALLTARRCRIDRAAEPGRRYDYLWSVGETLVGGPEESAERALRVIDQHLTPGGVAIFTGDFNLSAATPTTASEAGPFTREDVRKLVEDLTAHGHRVAPLPFELGLTAFDLLVDLPPFSSGLHMKALMGGSVVTSFGLIAFRDASDRPMAPR